jgi:hypothetical protein
LRLKSVYISRYKNLRDFSLTFDGSSFIDVFVASLQPFHPAPTHTPHELKANAMQTFNAHKMQKEKHNQILFKTV